MECTRAAMIPKFPQQGLRFGGQLLPRPKPSWHGTVLSDVQLSAIESGLRHAWLV